MSSQRIFSIIFLSVLFARCGNPDTPGITTTIQQNKNVSIPLNIPYQVIAVYPHDTAAYTQGLIWHDGLLIEGTGQKGESNIRKVDLETGKVLKQVDNKPDIFGEGITILGNRLYQITWQNRVGYIYDLKTLKLLKEFTLNTDGWGLTTNGVEFIYSDGSSNLYFLDTANFKELRRIGVTDNFGPVGNINELEWINGYVYANKYQTDYILKIDPESGRVVARIDFSALKGQAGFNVKDGANEVLNGIAYDSVNNRVFITGKYWPKLFEVKFDF